MQRDTLVDYFDEFARLPGEAVIYDTGYRTRSFTYPEIAAMARAFAARLRAHRIAKGDAVLLWSENRPGWIAALWGCLLEGAIVVPIDYRASPAFVRRIAAEVEARALLAGDEVAPPEDLPHLWRMAAIEQDSRASLDHRSAAVPDDIVQIVFTSGSTGEPKGVVIRHRNLLANLLPVEREIAKYRTFARPFLPLRFLNALPLSHLFGQTMAAFIPPMIASTVVFLGGFRPEEIVRQIRTRRVSVVVCVPKMLEVIRQYLEARYPETAHAPASGRWWTRWWRFRRIHRIFGFKFWAFIVGAAPLDPDLEEFWARLGFLVIQGYGLTETAPIVTLNHPFHVRRGSVGKPIGGVQVKIAEDGEILVRGPNVTSGYYHDEAGSTGEAFINGWFHTGDVGEIAPDGNLFVHGRKKDTIVTPEGLNVYPADVERVLEHMPGVKEAAVVGRDRVHAVLVMDPGANAGDAANQVVDQANRELEPHQRIHAVSLWPEPALPRTEGAGKLKRVQIQQWLLTGETPAAHPSPGSEPQPGVMAALARLAPGRRITPETSLEDLGLSSLERVQLMTEIERLRGGPVDETAMSEARHVAELLALSAKEMEGGQPAPAEPHSERYPRWNRSLAARALRRALLPSLVLPLTRHYARLEVHGREHLEALDEPAVFASNHQSHMDTPAILAALPPRYRYRVAPAMAKEFFTAFFHPQGHRTSQRLTRGLQYYLAALCFNAFPLPQRESGAAGALRYAGELAGAGWSILIFPEGRRTDAGEIQPFRPGVGMLATKLSLPVVPIRLRGLERVLHKTATHATRGPVEVSFGKPLRPSKQDWREFAEEVETAVRAL